MSIVKRILNNVDYLPPAPGVAQQVLRLAGDPDFSFAELMETVSMDAAITADVLRICNSPFYGLRRKISSLQQALTYLGSERVVEIVLTGDILTLYRHPPRASGLDNSRLWRHSLATAMFARDIGARKGWQGGSSVFTGALLHDMGKLVLGQVLEEEFDEINELISNSGMEATQAERQVLGADHALIGALVARQWNLPEEIVRIIAYHHDFSRSEKNRHLVAQVCLANLVINTVENQEETDGPQIDPPPELLERLGLAVDDMDEMIRAAQTVMEQAEEALNLVD